MRSDSPRFTGACSWSQGASATATHWMSPPPSTRLIAQLMLLWYIACHFFFYRLFSNTMFSSGTLGYCAPEMLDPTTAKVFFVSHSTSALFVTISVDPAPWICRRRLVVWCSCIHLSQRMPSSGPFWRRRKQCGRASHAHGRCDSYDWPILGKRE